MNIVGLVGVSGVGKSTLLTELKHSLQFLHLQASELLKSETAIVTGIAQTSEELRLGAVLSNQDMLVRAFRRNVAGSALPVVFDSHTVIDSRDGMIVIPAKVFQDIGLTSLVVLKAPAVQIAAQRGADPRVRPVRSIEEIDQHQSLTIAVAGEMAAELSIPLYTIEAADRHIIETLVREEPLRAD